MWSHYFISGSAPVALSKPRHFGKEEGGSVTSSRPIVVSSHLCRSGERWHDGLNKGARPDLCGGVTSAVPSSAHSLCPRGCHGAGSGRTYHPLSQSGAFTVSWKPWRADGRQSVDIVPHMLCRVLEQRAAVAHWRTLAGSTVQTWVHSDARKNGSCVIWLGHFVSEWIQSVWLQLEKIAIARLWKANKYNKVALHQYEQFFKKKYYSYSSTSVPPMCTKQIQKPLSSDFTNSLFHARNNGFAIKTSFVLRLLKRNSPSVCFCSPVLRCRSLTRPSVSIFMTSPFSVPSTL